MKKICALTSATMVVALILDICYGNYQAATSSLCGALGWLIAWSQYK